MIHSIHIKVEADTIDNTLITFTCPLCRKSIHSKKNATHTHGSGGNLDNRIEARGGDCIKSNWFIPDKDFAIDFQVYITDNTIRKI